VGLLRSERDLQKASKVLGNVTGSTRTALTKQLKPAIREAQELFMTRFGLTVQDAKIITSLTVDLFLREYPSGSKTGFVISGYGSEEYFPQVRSFTIESSVMGVHKIAHGECKDAARDVADIVPFAQTDMIETFLYGRTNRLDGKLKDFISQHFIEQKQQFANASNLSPAEIQGVISVLSRIDTDLKVRFAELLSDYTEKYHARPVRSTIAMMPKKDLAVMAEALVNLTSMKRRSTPDAETVGGPTDVAVISKGDGFVWIKRKHYFTADLNPNFIQAYYRERGQNEIFS